MIVVIDNFDSFVFNLARYFQRLGQPTTVVRNDSIDSNGIRRLNPQAVVFSPGPCTPREAGRSLELVKQLYRELPLLGVCLGHQTICQALGATLQPSHPPMHGRASIIEHDTSGLFVGLPKHLTVCRYHSLQVAAHTLPDCLRITACTTSGMVMAVAHRTLPVVGVQFHPESILTDAGYAMLSNFLRLAGLSVTTSHPSPESELATRLPSQFSVPPDPVTF